MTIEIQSLQRLHFSYLYLGHARIGDCFMDGLGKRVHALPAHAELQAELQQLKLACRDAQRGARAFRLDCGGASYRVRMMETSDGPVFVLRRLDSTLASLTGLGVPGAYARRLLRADLGGLVVIAGAAKSGKTSTAGALVREHLMLHGGVAMTIEEPIDPALEGAYGDGVCIQTLSGANRAADLQAALGCGARLIFVGTVDDPALIVDMLIAARDGHLLVSTVQADDVGRAIARLHLLASRVLDSQSVQTLLADGLAGVLHQRLAFRGPGQRQLEAQLLMLTDSTLARSQVRNGRFDELGDELRQQMMAMIHSDALASLREGA
jgi:Tfp pilus assembly pilus retraction ATPase PilT